MGDARDELGRYGRPRPGYLFRELLGVNRIDSKYLYVTDGGHYENLGLVELLRRGCTQIYCFDASGGDSFTALGDAIAIARSELGVEIDLDLEELAKLRVPPPAAPAAAGSDAAAAPATSAPAPTSPAVAEKPAISIRFKYRHGPRGLIVYARNVLSKKSPYDAVSFAEIDPAFPHDSTIDQLYTDQKFEAYRVLGEVAGTAGAELMALAPDAAGPPRRRGGPSPS